MPLIVKWKFFFCTHSSFVLCSLFWFTLISNVFAVFLHPVIVNRESHCSHLTLGPSSVYKTDCILSHLKAIKTTNWRLEELKMWKTEVLKLNYNLSKINRSVENVSGQLNVWFRLIMKRMKCPMLHADGQPKLCTSHPMHARCKLWLKFAGLWDTFTKKY